MAEVEDLRRILDLINIRKLKVGILSVYSQMTLARGGMRTWLWITAAGKPFVTVSWMLPRNTWAKLRRQGMTGSAAVTWKLMKRNAYRPVWA